MANKPCPFCTFDKQTEIFYYDRWKHVIICQAKDNLGFKHRLLVVRTGPAGHKPMPTMEERSELMVPLIAVAEAQVRNGQASGYDVEEIVDSDHYHYLVNFT